MIQQASRLAPGEQQEEVVCRHHWIIEAPTGPISRGVCQLCEEVREFKNYIEAAPWGEDTPANQPSSRYPVDSSSENAEDFEES